MRQGINVDPANGSGRPSPAELRARGFNAVRFVVRFEPAIKEYYDQCVAEGIEMLGVLTPQTFGTDVPSPDVVVLVTDAVCREFPELRLISIGNEPDARAFDGLSKAQRQEKAPSSWVMEREEYQELHNRAAQILRAHNRTVFTAGLCSGRADWLDPILPALDFDVCLTHPYDKGAEAARTLINEYRGRVAGRPIGASEWFRDAGEVAAFAEMLRQEGVDNWFFCWSDGMVEPFGLLGLDAQPKAAGTELFAFLSGGIPFARPTFVEPDPMPEAA